MTELYGPGGYVGAGYVAVVEAEPPPPANPAPFPDLLVLIDFEQPASLGLTPKWTDCTEVLLQGSLSIKRGRQRELDRIEAGDLQLAFFDELGAFDPDNQGTLAGKIKPSLRIRVEALVDYDPPSVAWTNGQSYNGSNDIHGGGSTFERIAIFDGVIEDWDYVYPGRGATGFVNLRAVDWLGPLQREKFNWRMKVILQDPLGNPEATEEVAYGVMAVNRIKSILARKPWGLAKDDIREDKPSQPDWRRSKSVTPIDYVDAPMLDAVQEAVGVDGGNFFATRDGKYQYIGPEIVEQPFKPGYVLSPSTNPYTDVTFAYDENVIYNDIEVSNTETGSVSPVSNAESVADFFTRPFEVGYPFDNVQDQQARASEILDRYGQPRRIVLQMLMDGTISDYQTILSMDLWTKVLAQVRLPNGQELDQISLVEGIEINSPSRQKWTVSLWLSEAPFPELLDDELATFEGGVGGWESAQANTVVTHAAQILYENWSGFFVNLQNLPSSIGLNHGWWMVLQATDLEGDTPDLGLSVLARTREIPVSGNQDYRLTGKMKITGTSEEVFEASTEDPPPQAHLELVWYDANHVELSRVLTETYDMCVPGFVGFFRNPIVPFKLEAKSPSAAEYVRIYASGTRVWEYVVADGVSTGTAATIEDQYEVSRGLMFDDLSFRRI